MTRAELDEMRGVLDAVRPGVPLADSPIHGERHWQTVSLIGARLAAETPGANVRAVMLFGAIHDCRRENDHFDPAHGLRAAELVDELHASGHLLLAPSLLARLREAVARHDEGQTTIDPVVGACWDADRLCLPRVGIEPDVELLSTRGGRAHREWAASLQSPPLPDWERVLNTFGCLRSEEAISR